MLIWSLNTVYAYMLKFICICLFKLSVKQYGCVEQWCKCKVSSMHSFKHCVITYFLVDQQVLYPIACTWVADLQAKMS